jgi:hypothetical protein
MTSNDKFQDDLKNLFEEEFSFWQKIIDKKFWPTLIWS